MRVLIFGDSLVHGQFDSQGGWATRLHRDALKAYAADLTGNRPFIFNLGIGGDTTRGVIKRFTTELAARSWDGEEYAFVFAIGINDTLTFEHTPPVSNPEQYAKELRELYGLAQKASKRIMFVGLLPVEDDKVAELYTSQRVWQFERVLRDFVAEQSIPSVPLFEYFQKQMRAGKRLFVDGLHPNDEGHKRIYEQVKPALQALLES